MAVLLYVLQRTDFVCAGEEAMRDSRRGVPFARCVARFRTLATAEGSEIRGRTKRKEIDMHALISKSPYPLLWIAGIAVTWFCAVGIGAFMGWIPM